LQEDTEIEVATSVEVCGLTYKKGCCIVTGYSHDLPEFGEVKDIVCHLSRVYLVVKLLNTIEFTEHFHSFGVSVPTVAKWKVLLQSELHDYHVLHKTCIVDHSGRQRLVIVARYDLEDR
jgi:hypothetical protein